MNGQAGSEGISEAQPATPIIASKRRRRSPAKAPAKPPFSAVIAREFWDWSKPKIVGWFSMAIMALVAGGWIMLPAKQSDLDALRVELRAGFAAIDGKFKEVSSQMLEANARLGEVRNTYEAIRNDLAAKGAQEARQASSAPPAPVAPARPRSRPARPPAPAKATNMFGF